MKSGPISSVSAPPTTPVDPSVRKAPTGPLAPTAGPPDAAPVAMEARATTPPATDTDVTQQVKTYTGTTLGQGFKDLPVATDRDLTTFIQSHKAMAASSVIRAGEHLVVKAGDDVIKVKISDLATLLGNRDNPIRISTTPADKTLLNSLLVYEAAYNAGLSNGATNAILRGYAKALKDGGDSHEALTKAYTNIAVATQIEAYVENKDGLAQDMRHTAEFTKEAFDGNTAGGTFAAIRNRTIRAEAIKQAQGHLDDRLHKFTNAFATARESGDYGAAFDALQAFFRTSATVAETDYWRQRGSTVVNALQSRLPSGPRDAQAPLALREAADLSAPRAPKITKPALQAGEASSPYVRSGLGRLWDNVNAGVRHLVGQSKVATTSTALEGAASQVKAIVSNTTFAVSGNVWKAPTPSVPSVVTPRTVSRSESTVERSLLEYLQGMRAGAEASLSGEVGASIGIAINAVDFIPVAGEALSSAGVLAARVGVGADASAKVTAALTCQADGSFLATVTQEYAGTVSADGSVGSGAFNLKLDGRSSAAAGHRRVMTMRFANAEDAAAFFAHPSSHGGRTKGDALSPGTYTATFKAENFIEGSGEVSVSDWVSKADRSSGGSLPSRHTTTNTNTIRIIDRGEDDVVEQLSFRVATRAGSASSGPVASDVRVEFNRKPKADGSYQLENPSMTMDLSVTKLQNLAKTGSDGERALNILVAKMTQRVNTALKQAAELGGLGSDVDLSATETAVRQALTALRDRAPAIFSGRGVSTQSQLGLLGISYLSGDLASLRFDLHALSGGKIGISAPRIGVASETRVAVSLDVKKIVTVRAGVAANSWREASETVPAAVMPHTAPASGTEVRTHSKAAGEFYAVRHNDGVRTTYADVTARLKMEYTELVNAIKPDARAEDLNALVDKLVTNMTGDLLKGARGEGFGGDFDVAKSKESVRAALMLLRGQYETIVKHRKKTDYTVPLDSFAAIVQQRAFYRWDNKVKLDFRMVRDDKTGKFALVNPLTVKANTDREATAARTEESASLLKRMSVHTKKSGEFYQQPGDEGLRTTFTALKLDYKDLMKAIGPDVTPKQLNGLVDTLATHLHEDLLVEARKQGYQATLDLAQTKAAIRGALGLLRARHDEITARASGAGFAVAEGELPFTIGGPGFAATIERRGMIRDHKVKLHFQLCTDPSAPDQQRLLNPLAYAEHLKL